MKKTHNIDKYLTMQSTTTKNQKGQTLTVKDFLHIRSSGVAAPVHSEKRAEQSQKQQLLDSSRTEITGKLLLQERWIQGVST